MDIPHEFVPVLLVQIGLFLALWMLLKRVWFDPALKILTAREERSQGAVAAAKTMQDEAERLRRQHAAAIDQAKSEAQQEVQDILRRAEAEQRRVLAEANDEAQKTLATARSQIATEVASARRDLSGQAEAIAREVAKAIMGRAV